MKKRRMRLMALVVAAMMICGLAIAEPVHEHQWSAWQKSMDYPNQETRTCLTCNAVETREHEWGPWIDQGDGTEKHICQNCLKEEIRKIETPAEPMGEGAGGENAGISLLNENAAGTTPGTDPNTDAGTTPAAAPNADAGTTPGTDPNADAGTTPGTDPNADADTGTDKPDGDPVVGQAQMTISLAVDRSEAKAGDTLTYTATVKNEGTADAQGVKVSFILPGELQITATSYGDVQVESTLAELKQGETATVWLAAKVLESAVHGAVLTVTASVDGTVSNAQETTVLEQPQLMLDCIASSDTVTAGEALEYTVTLTNAGRGPATNAAVAVTLPQGIENVTPAAPAGPAMRTACGRCPRWGLAKACRLS